MVLNSSVLLGLHQEQEETPECELEYKKLPIKGVSHSLQSTTTKLMIVRPHPRASVCENIRATNLT